MISVPPNFIWPVVNLPVKLTSENPDTLPLAPATTTLLAETVPSVTDVTLFISCADAVIAVPPKVIESVVRVPSSETFLNPLISLLESATTALESLTVPSLTPCKVFNSAAVDVTKLPANLRPDEVVLWDTISNISGPLVVPILVTPVVPWVITLALVVSPTVIPSRTARELAFKVVDPNTRFPSTLRLLVICCEPLTVTSPAFTTTLPLESIVILSEAAAEPPVINDKVVGLAVELKSPSDFATIEAPTIVATSPVASSGDWNSILPRTSFTWTSVVDDCNFNTEPSSLLEVILLTVVVPEISMFAAVAFLVIDTSLKPEISPLVPAITTFPAETAPSTTWSNLLIWTALDDISVPPRFIELVVNFPETPTSLNPLTSLLASTTTALLADTVPLVIPERLLISAATAVISSPPRLIEAAVNLPVNPTFLNPLIFASLSAITTLPAVTVPPVTPSNLLISSEIAVISTPLISSVWALNSPVIVILFTPVISLLASNTTALESLAVPGVTPSM